MDSMEPMPTLANESMLARLVETARQKVVEGMAAMSRSTSAAASQLAADLHTIAGEAATLNKPELSKAAADGEEAARLLANGKTDALVPCMRSLRRLGYLLQETTSETRERRANAGRPDPSAELRRLLVVDDSPVAALALADVFEAHDFSVRTASTLDDAVQQISLFSPAILISDVHMPNLDVAELCRRFREAAADRKNAVILVSGRTESELSDRLHDVKFDAFVSKLSGAVAVVTRVSAICRELLA
jgi:CheY-like chemotaxis protein/HPt (histidine-containing phosphotransfer) domain-containing protein